MVLAEKPFDIYWSFSSIPANKYVTLSAENIVTEDGKTAVKLKFIVNGTVLEYTDADNPIRQVVDLLGHSTSQIAELYYVKKDTSRLSGITEGFEI